jgi:predicted phage-related endonuclease
MIDQAKRRNRIGGSQVAALFGAHPYLDEHDLWLQVTGQSEDYQPSEEARQGQIFERAILDWYSYKTGYDLDTDCGSVCPEGKPYMVVSPDAICRNVSRGVDAKKMSWFSWQRLTQPGEEIPQYIQFQCWYYLLGLGHEAYDVCALVGGEPRIFAVEREEDALKVLEERTFEWHQRYIVRGEEPPVGTGVITARWLQRAFAHHKRPDMRQAREHEQVLLDEYLQLRIELLAKNPLMARREQLEALLKRAVGDSEGLKWAGGEFTWRKPQDSVETDWEKLARRLMDPMSAEVRDAWILEHTSAKSNSRRIHLKSELLRDAELASKKDL